MLSSEYIHEKILDTTSCTSEDVRKLAELMELYPYVSSFPILYLKALANSKDVRLESEIEKYAYRISSRALLFELLHPRFEIEITPEKETIIQEEVQAEIVKEDENPILQTVEVEEETIPEVKEKIVEEIENHVLETIVVEEETIPEVKEKIVEEIENPVLEKIEGKEEIVPEVQAEIIEEIENSILEKIEVEEEIVPKEKSEEFKKENDQLEQLIQAAAISSSFMETNFQEEEKETKLEIEKPISETIIVEEEITPEVQEEIVEEIEKPISETIVVEEEITPEVQVEILEEIEKPISEAIVDEEEIVPEVQEVIVEEIENPVSEKIEVKEETISEEESEEIKKENDQLEQLIQASAFSSSFMETNFHEVEKETKLEPEIEKTLDSELVAEKKIEKITTPEKTEIEPKSERSFSSWLSLGATTSAVNPMETKVIKKETKHPEIEEETKKIEYYNFDKPKKEFYSPVKKAKESLSENNMPVSETLAKIFALQGNYPKSIYVYEQLILIFPEKKSFFATQIKNLKKKLNS
jgi:hypothetical protein